MELSARVRTKTIVMLAALAGCGGWFAPSARAQGYNNMIWGGVPDQSGLNGLWWGSYDAFSPSSQYAWWNFYLPPAEPYWNGPYFTAAHEEPYIPMPIRWNGLEYSEANAPPESTRPHGWYGLFSSGWRSDPAYAREYWEYIEPDRRARAAAAAEARAASAPKPERTVPRPPPQARQYTRDPGQKGWRVHDARDAGTQLEPAPTEPRGFTQYYRQTAPGPNQGRWVKKSAPVAPPSR